VAQDADGDRPPTLLELPSYLAGHASRIAHRELVDGLARHELRLPHFAVLVALHDFGSTVQHELADRLRLNRSHLAGYLDHLERGWGTSPGPVSRGTGAASASSRGPAAAGSLRG
jgi:hypothetical protein